MSDLAALLNSPCPSNNAGTLCVDLSKFLGDLSKKNTAFPSAKLDDDVLKALGDFDLSTRSDWADVVRTSKSVSLDNYIAKMLYSNLNLLTRTKLPTFLFTLFIDSIPSICVYNHCFYTAG